MLFIETTGTWRQMGAQVGEAFRDQLRMVIDRYHERFVGRSERSEKAVAAVEAMVLRYCPELVEETEGMAQGAGVDRNVMMGQRFFSDVKNFMRQDCSVIYLADVPGGPLMARNCDLNPVFDPEIQVCQVARPSDGTASIRMVWLGAVGQGINEFGVVIGAASAHAARTFGHDGVPGALLGQLIMRDCRTAAEARALLARHVFLGKGANLIVGDARGDSLLVEMVGGRTPILTPRAKDRAWQACTNFYFSPEIPNRPKADYLENAYARYGRIAHQFEWGGVEHTFEGLKTLITEVAQPGLCCPGGENRIVTAYSQIMDPVQRRMYLCPGNPGALPFEAFAL